MATGSITIKGNKEFLAKLKQLGSKTTAKKVLRAGVRAAAADVRKVMRSIVPVDEGDLKKSIVLVVRNKGYNMSAYVGADDSYSRPDPRHVNGKMPYFYDHLAENGWEGRDGRSYAGSHYVARTYAQTKDRSDAIMLAKAVSQLEKEMAKGAGK